MTWQTRLTRANATSLCTSVYYLRHHYQCIILGLWIFWAYDFVCIWFVCVWSFCAYDFSVRMIFMTILLFLLLIVRTRINWQCIQTSCISASENRESFYLLLHLLGVCTSHQGDEGQKMHPIRPIPHAVPQLYWAFSNQSMVARHSLWYTLLTWHLLGISWPLG